MNATGNVNVKGWFLDSDQFVAEWSLEQLCENLLASTRSDVVCLEDITSLAFRILYIIAGNSSQASTKREYPNAKEEKTLDVILELSDVGESRSRLPEDVSVAMATIRQAVISILLPELLSWKGCSCHQVPSDEMRVITTLIHWMRVNEVVHKDNILTAGKPRRIFANLVSDLIRSTHKQDWRGEQWTGKDELANDIAYIIAWFVVYRLPAKYDWKDISYMRVYNLPELRQQLIQALAFSYVNICYPLSDYEVITSQWLETENYRDFYVRMNHDVLDRLSMDHAYPLLLLQQSWQ